MSPESKLKLLRKIEPDQNWLSCNWQRLQTVILSEVPVISSEEALSASKREISVLFQRSLAALEMTARVVYRFAPAFAVLLLILSSIAVVSASSNSIPGDTLYPLKLAIEKLRIAATPSAEIHTEFAGERLDEFRKITAREVSEKNEKVLEVVKNLKNEVSNTQKQLVKLEKKKDSKKIAQRAKNIQEKTKAFGEALTKVSEELPQGTKQEVAQEVKEALVAIADTNVTSLKVLIEGSVKEVITESEVKALVDQAIKDEETSVKAVSQFLSSPRDTTKKLKEARDLLSKKDLKGAILKIAEIHQSVKEASAKKDELEKEIIIFTPKKGIQEVTP